MPSDQALRARAIQIIKRLQVVTSKMEAPAATQIVDQFGQSPYLILISCILSLRTKDTVSLPASLRLFKHAQTPQTMLKVPLHTIEELIYPTGFYRTKAKNIHAISKTIIEKFDSRVPSTQKELMSLQGVGLKTANLVLAEGFGIPAICVDTHVHRISNRLGLIKTKTVEQTEQALQKILPKEYWSQWNKLLVIWGQNICVPISPFCSKCPIADLCPRVGVEKSR
jgi:endonuclease-3